MNVLLMTSASDSGFHIAPPLGLYRLKHYLQDRGVGCDIFDFDLEEADPFLEKTERGAFDIVGMSVSHYRMSSDLDLLWRFRGAAERGGRDTLFVAGGQEATLNAEQWLDAGVDLVLTGFAEEGLFELCRRWGERASDRPHPFEVARGMAGVAFRDETGELRLSPSPALTGQKFRELSYDLVRDHQVPWERYWAKVRSQRSAVAFNQEEFVVENVRLYTSSHCPRGCGFCSSQSFLPASQGRPFPPVFLSAEEVHELVLCHVKRYGARSFLFSDDDFLIGTPRGIDRALDFSARVARSKGAGELPATILFNCQARVSDFLTRNGGATRAVHTELADSLRRAGFHSIGLGVETFSDRLLRAPSIRKAGVTAADCRAVIEALLERGLVPQINIILAIPESTPDEMAQTMRVVVGYIRSGCNVAITPKMRSIPGSPIFGSERYPATQARWRNPRTGGTIEIADSYIPHDPRVASIVDEIEPAAKAELRRVTSETSWAGATPPKSLLGLSTLIAAARLLGRADLAEELVATQGEIVDRSLSARHEWRSPARAAESVRALGSPTL